MERLMSGTIIKQLRQAKKMTQEELANEICNVRTLRKIENGENSTKQILFEHLLEKLGEDTDKYSFHSQNLADNKIYDTIVEIRDLIQKRMFLNARDKYNELCENNSFVSAVMTNNNPTGKIYRQYSLHWEAVFLHILDNKNEEALEKEYQAIHETFEDSDLSDIENKVLSDCEYVIINAIALLHFCMEETDKGIEVLTKLKLSLSKPSVSKQLKSRALPFICYNLSKFLCKEKRYTEAMIVCDEGIEACEKAQSSRHLGQLYYNKATVIFNICNKDIVGTQEYFFKSYHAFLAVNDYEMAEIVKRNTLEIYGISL